MINVSNLTLHFGERPMFDEVSFFIGKEDRIGRWAGNGAGKSTLLKMLAGEDKPDSGSIDKPRDLTVGYLPNDEARPAAEPSADRDERVQGG